MKTPNAPPIAPEIMVKIIKNMASTRFIQLKIDPEDDVVEAVEANELKELSIDANIPIKTNKTTPKAKPVITIIIKPKKDPLIYPSLIFLQPNIPVTIEPKNAIAKTTKPT